MRSLHPSVSGGNDVETVALWVLPVSVFIIEVSILVTSSLRSIFANWEASTIWRRNFPISLFRARLLYLHCVASTVYTYRNGFIFRYCYRSTWEETCWDRTTFDFLLSTRNIVTATTLYRSEQSGQWWRGLLHRLRRFVLVTRVPIYVDLWVILFVLLVDVRVLEFYWNLTTYYLQTIMNLFESNYVTVSSDIFSDFPRGNQLPWAIFPFCLLMQ